MTLLQERLSELTVCRTNLVRAVRKSAWIPVLVLALLGIDFNAVGQISLYSPETSPSSSATTTTSTDTTTNSTGTSLYNPGTSLYTPQTSTSTNGTSLYTPGASLYTPGTSLYNTGISLTDGVEVKETPKEIKIKLRGDILFDFDKADIRQSAEPTLNQIVKLIQRYPRAVVRIAGFTDSKGSVPYNLDLSRRRASSVKAWLAARGILEHIMSTKGYGAEHPVAPNTNPDGSDNPAGRQQNRRVELTIKK